MERLPGRPYLRRENGGEMKYVIQQMTGAEGRWDDVTTVEAAPKAKRRTVLKAAKLTLTAGNDAEQFRVLNEASAHVYTVKAKQQTTLEID